MTQNSEFSKTEKRSFISYFSLADQEGSGSLDRPKLECKFYLTSILFRRRFYQGILSGRESKHHFVHPHQDTPHS